MAGAKVIVLKKQDKKIPVIEEEPVKEDAGLYIKMIRLNPRNQKPYNRLMVIYRKMKQYKKELAIINKAIKTFDSIYKSRKKAAGKQVTSLSRQLNKSLGLTDKKGNRIFESEPLAGWRKRKDTVIKKIK